MSLGVMLTPVTLSTRSVTVELDVTLLSKFLRDCADADIPLIQRIMAARIILNEIFMSVDIEIGYTLRKIFCL